MPRRVFAVLCLTVLGSSLWVADDGTRLSAAGPVRPPDLWSGNITAVNLQQNQIEVSRGPAGFRYFVSRATQVVVIIYFGNPPAGGPYFTRYPGTLADLKVGQNLTVHARNGHAYLIEIIYYGL